MAEKQGHLEKMIYDFPTETVLEIYLDKLNNWYRVTSTTFRSFDGLRRYIKPTYQPRRLELTKINPPEIIEYKGPVFMFRTNQQVYYTGSGVIIDSTKTLIERQKSNNRKS